MVFASEEVTFRNSVPRKAQWCGEGCMCAHLTAGICARSARSVDQPRGADERENGTDEWRNEREWEQRDSERRRKGRKRYAKKRDHLRLARRAPSGYSRDGVRSFLHFISALKMLLRGPSWHECRAARLFPRLIPSLSLSFYWVLFSLSSRSSSLLQFQRATPPCLCFNSLPICQNPSLSLFLSLSIILSLFLSLSHSIVRCSSTCIPSPMPVYRITSNHLPECRWFIVRVSNMSQWDPQPNSR